ncbi:MAG: DUF1579 family protein [Planctomycetota bacterium]
MKPRLPLAAFPLLLTAAAFVPALAAQDHDWQVEPAKELAKYAPLVGNWAGGGTMTEPTGQTSEWTAHGTYRWVLNKHWLQEDFVIRFEALEMPIVFHSYWGWDGENQRYIGVVTSSEGKVLLNTPQFLADGSMVTLARHVVETMAYGERSTLKVDGDTMMMNIDLLMPEGDLQHTVTGTMKRTDKVCDGDPTARVWMDAPVHEHIKRAGKMCGSYAVAGEMVMAPGMPASKITGEDLYESMWGGSVLHARTNGVSEGSDETYESHAYWAWDMASKCMKCVYVDNMGMVGDMDCRWLKDQIVSTDATLMMGEPTTQRFVVTLDDAGRLASGLGHTSMGVMAPFVSFKATYKPK